MNSDGFGGLIGAQIDAWLRGWHAWASSERVGSGYPSRAAGCSLWRASRQMDDFNGALDQAADIAEAEAVHAVISEMTPTHQHALAIEAKNLGSRRVWRSPRIDADRLPKITAEARVLLWDGMRRKGLV